MSTFRGYPEFTGTRDDLTDADKAFLEMVKDARFSGKNVLPSGRYVTASKIRELIKEQR